MVRVVDGRQVRAARALLGWNREELQRLADVSPSALLRLETGQADSRGSTIRKVMTALEEHGIEFLDTETGGIGVMFEEAKQVRNHRAKRSHRTGES